ncbi:DUF7674 family protein [Cytobacillus gottheilii]|uniref:DUF7674 family protein n=1 Tax=Cytobacillus gottheilii TaxID=859144 RepID=UPI003CFA9F56
MMDTIKILIEEFNDLKPVLQEHIEFYEGLLPHVYFGECNEFFINYINEDNPQELQRLFTVFEIMATQGNDEVVNTLSVTILERLGDDRKVLNTARKYMGKVTRKLSDETEKGWGRY